MKYVFRKIFNALVQLGEIAAGLYVLKELIGYFLSNYNLLPTYLKFLALSLLVVILLLLFKKTSLIFNHFKKKKLESDINSSFKEKSKTSSLSIKDIPTNKKIQKWVDLATIRAKEWTNDAEFHKALISYSIYVRNGKINHNLPLGFFSSNKSEYLTIYLHGTELLEETAPDRKINIDGEVPFYEKQPNWRSAVISVYKHFEDRIFNDFDIFITTSSDNHIFINFTYYRGKKKVKSHNSFTFDGVYASSKNLKIKV